MRYWNEIIIDYQSSVLSLSLSFVYITVIISLLGGKGRKIGQIIGEVIIWFFMMQFFVAIYYQLFGNLRHNMVQEISFIILYFGFKKTRRRDVSFVIGCATWAASTLIMSSSKFIEEKLPRTQEQAAMVTFYGILFALSAWFIHRYEVEEYMLTARLSVVISGALALAGFMSTNIWDSQKEVFSYRGEAQNLAFLILLLLIYYLFYFVNEEYLRNLSLIAVQNKVEIDKNNYEVTQKHYDEMRMLRHEIKNHDAYVKMLVEQEEFNKLKEFLTESEKNNENILRKNDYGNALVSAIINDQIRKATAKNVEMNVTASIPEKIGLPEMDLFSLVANIFDNAREAEEKLPEGAQRYIKGSIVQNNNYLFIHVENNIDASKDRKDILTLSTDKLNRKAHGYGTKIISLLVQRHNGTVHYDVKGDTFFTDVMVEVKE